MAENTRTGSIDKLAIRAKSGDKDALNKLVTAPEIKGIIYKTAYEKIGKEHSEDIYQRVCITIWQKIHTWQGQTRIAGWIKRVTYNDCIDYLRSTKPDKLIFPEELPVEHVEAGQDRYVLNQEKHQLITQALSELETFCQQVLQRFLFEGEKKQTIMQSIQLKKSTFYGKFNDCCAKLQHNIQHKL